ncbi:putative ATP-dependent zinc metalloprotease [Babesia sp. Xinjiang]|uniref:putative ATP-dependent zinc metalloprotease n=1 Tax=Babesia sp. Xinjiang TaxID=462227 RepID=UPI000A25754E|nr:putative ATP-dependent zinc metalloprotease [Babesia sp. Xinjiang]ORM41493.1 putative ATP-dependent zinc metalloprotease [Babesia sp. Xinjiang]
MAQQYPNVQRLSGFRHLNRLQGPTRPIQRNNDAEKPSNSRHETSSAEYRSNGRILDRETISSLYQRRYTIASSKHLGMITSPGLRHLSSPGATGPLQDNNEAAVTLNNESDLDNGVAETPVDQMQLMALEAAFELREGETMDWNNKQMCRVSHRNLVLYMYNNIDMATVIKITNQVLAAYQTLPRRRKASQRRQYVQRFLRCIRKHRPIEDHPQLARWLLRCIDLLTCDDLYSMLRVRHIVNYDNSFETFRASFGMENFETFSNLRTTKVQQDKLIGEKALKSRTAQRNLLMRHLKINKFRFLKDQNVTKAVYEANIEWCDAGVEAAALEPQRFAFIYNLPFIEKEELTEALHEVLSRFSKVKHIEILFDRLPPLTSFVKRSAVPRNAAPPPRDKYSPLYALVEFQTEEDRDYLCDEHIRVFGLICCGRVVYPELAERKRSLLTAIYPPFRRMDDALQFIANTLVEQPNAGLTSHGTSASDKKTTEGKKMGNMNVFENTSGVYGTDTLDGSTVSDDSVSCSTGHERDEPSLLQGENVTSATSQCRILPLSKRKKVSTGASHVVTADTQSAIGDWPTYPQPELDNHVDSSMLDKLQNKAAASASMDPQWIVLRFCDFKHAYFARKKLMQKFAEEPRSLVSFDTKRSIFHNGKYVDLPLFQYSTRTENDPSVARITQNTVEDGRGIGSVAGDVALAGRPPRAVLVTTRVYESLLRRSSLRFSTHRLLRVRRNVEDELARGRLDAHTLREANRVDPRLTVNAVESNGSGSFPRDEGVLREYLKALMLTNNIDSRSLKELIPPKQVTETSHAPTYDVRREEQTKFAYEPNEMYLKSDARNPVHVVVSTASGSRFVRFFKGLLSFGSIAFCFGSLYVVLNQNIHRGLKHSFKVVDPEEVDTTFADVKGCDEVKKELDDIVAYLRNPEKFDKLGARLPKGVLLAGPPGTGKTLLARAVAGEAGVPFIQASGSEFEEMFVGVGARRIRELFALARTMSPCIVFIDELDAVGSKRSATDHNSVRMTLNQLLVELDGFAKREGIVVLCATNFPESLDPALVRPGRLDRTIHIPLPDYNGRYDILKLYSKKILVAPDVDLSTVAKRTVGMTGADIFNILNMAALKCSLQGLAAVTSSAIEEAFDRVVVGLKGTPLTSEREKKATAYHEGGHTLVSLHTPGATQVHKATIAPRGRTLGVTWKIPEEKSDTRMSELHAEIAVLMGGMAAEEVIYGKENVSTGCQSDLEKATDIARTMVMNFGVGLENVKGPMFLDAKGYSNLSEEHRSRVDTAVQQILDKGYRHACNVIRGNILQLHNLSDALVQYETLNADEIHHAVRGEMREIEHSQQMQQNEIRAQTKRYSQTQPGNKELLTETQHSYRTSA